MFMEGDWMLALPRISGTTRSLPGIGCHCQPLAVRLRPLGMGESLSPNFAPLCSLVARPLFGSSLLKFTTLTSTRRPGITFLWTASVPLGLFMSSCCTMSRIKGCTGRKKKKGFNQTNFYFLAEFSFMEEPLPPATPRPIRMSFTRTLPFPRLFR